jgi:hypothetical protein
MKKELMLSAPCFNKKNISRDFDPGIVKKIFEEDKPKNINLEPEKKENESNVKENKPRTRAASKPKVQEVTENE